MSWDTSGDRKDWVAEGDEFSAARRVPELLAEQVEAANLILINKVDLAGPGQVEVATSVARALNDKAEWKQVIRGDIDPWTILGLEDPTKTKKKTTMTTSCSDVTCNDPTHNHEHSHNHESNHVEGSSSSSSSSTCSDPVCTHPSHSHEHSHNHDAQSACADPICTDPTHTHEHSHNHQKDASTSSCTDTTCNDPTHDHSHSHNHATSTKNLGISSFVFKANRPFNANRLLGLLNQWPVPIKDELDLSVLAEAAVEGFSVQNKTEKSPFVGVLRSKGFCWLAPTRWSASKGDAWRHDTAMYWSHAGKHFGITTAGKWWGTLDPERMKEYFSNNPKEYDRILRDDWVSTEFGDRRQELVFIGVQLNEEDIRDTLNACLCTDEEMETYRRQLRNFVDITLTVASSSGPSLFDVGGVSHVE